MIARNVPAISKGVIFNGKTCKYANDSRKLKTPLIKFSITENI